MVLMQWIRLNPVNKVTGKDSIEVENYFNKIGIIYFKIIIKNLKLFECKNVIKSIDKNIGNKPSDLILTCVIENASIVETNPTMSRPYRI
jgi:hypothetical protein